MPENKEENRDQKPSKSKSLSIFMYILPVAVLSIITIYFAYPAIRQRVEIWQNKGVYTQIVTDIKPTSDAAPAPTASLLPDNTPPPSPAIAAPRTVLTEIADMRRTFSNDDIIGFLEIEGTGISYPVTQAADNEYYLNRDLYGNDSSAGTIYMDYENNLDLLDDNTVIYGHNMRNGSMFHDLRYYFDKQFYEEHPLISLTTLYEETVWEIFAFYQTSTDFYYIQTRFIDRASFFSLLWQMKSKSVYDTGIIVENTDKILTLSTCANEGGDQRYVLNAKLITN